jgi:hypothetical protein
MIDDAPPELRRRLLAHLYAEILNTRFAAPGPPPVDAAERPEPNRYAAPGAAPCDRGKTAKLVLVSSR